ncbi:MAG: ParB/RepB/Spo0J family partition protein [Chloroflexi bacterium]|nr:ParB/RepB/Spo0J family partition protein [Chloroflexota bacterium]MDA1240975.1 ParB/RepB/Spo0J family partition protein [Chloroflexota bacterium]MQC19378.1 ParB/RepB/Spo0J family partition protein [Chloroflexota bacterium]
MARKGGLGRGLSALIPEGDPSPRDESVPVTEVATADVVPNPHQPRVAMDPAKLQELTDSILTYGIIQPLLVTEVIAQDGSTVYQLIAGERRLRAARAAGIDRVPVTIRQSTTQEQLEIAIVENVQRADLNPLEEAAAYQRLAEEFGLTQAQVAERVGKSRTAVANTLRLMDLPVEIRGSISGGEITEGHGRALLGLPDGTMRLTAWERVVKDGLNVRETERMVREWAGAPKRPTRTKAPEVRGPEAVTAGFQEALQRSLGTKVALRRSKQGKGSLTIHFYSDEELTGILERILGEEAL